MRIEVAELVLISELEPGDIYSEHPQDWWDLTLAAKQIGVPLYVRSEFPLPDAYLPMSTHKITILKDEDGVAPSQEVHILDDPPSDEVEEPTSPFCGVCGGMGTGDTGDPCEACGGSGIKEVDD